MRFSTLNSQALLLGLLMVSLETPAISRETCGSFPPSYKVCFSTYEVFVEKRSLLLAFGLKLEHYIPDMSGRECFLERIPGSRLFLFDDLEEQGVLESLATIALEDIAPVLSSRAAYGRCEPRRVLDVFPEELMVRLESAAAANCFLQELKGHGEVDAFGELNNARRFLRLLEFRGPFDGADEEEERTDQVKVSFSKSRGALGDGGGELLSPTHEAELALALSQFGITRIDPFQYAALRNDRTSGVMQSGDRYYKKLFERGLSGRGQIVGIIDDSLDTQHCFFNDLERDRPGSSHRKLQGYRSSGNAASLHGTFVAGIAAGQSSRDASEPNNGQAPKARISFDSVWDIATRGLIRSVLYQTLQQQYDDGARIFSNSWGDSERGWYTNWAYDIDRFTREKEDALVLFAVHNDGHVMSPENAKNVLAVGASKQANLRNHRGRAGKGPTCGGQRKPEIFAPGCRIRSALVDQEAAHQMPHGTTCGIGQRLIQHPQEPPKDYVQVIPMHLSSCATSWASPAVAGGAVLAREHLRARKPSGALLKATLLNATRDLVMPDEEAAEYPSDREGWGWLVLDDALYFDGDDRKSFMYDVWKDHGFMIASPPARYKIRTTRSVEPLKVTLVWTDPPPASIVRGNPAVNDLNLSVKRINCAEEDSCFFRGNDFSDAGFSRSHKEGLGRSDKLNNVEQILIPASAGDYCITVVGERIRIPKQGYALVATGPIESMEPSAEDCTKTSATPH